MKKFKQTVAAILATILFLLPANISAFAVSRDTMTSKLISIAQNEVGYTGTSSYSKYGEWYGYQGGWCTTFALWCFNKTGEALGVKLYANIVPSGGNCNSMISWFKNKGRYHTRSSGYTPQKGDLVFFDWSGNGSANHVGIVKSTSGSTVYTIEGNCSGKVKAKTYTTSGSKPYMNVSSILGYGAPNWSAVGSGDSATTTTATTTKAATTTAKPTTKATTATTASAATTTNEETKKETTTKKPTTTTTTTTTEAPVPAKDMKIRAATTELQIGDSVKLDYEIEPLNANAVVGYFCDEDDIIDISDKGVITATGEGTATVVVCANDEIYRQCDFTVTKVSTEVTTQRPVNNINLGEQSTLKQKSKNQILGEMGINVEKLTSHKDYYIIPLGIIGVTGILVAAIMGIKAISKAIRKKKEQ